MMAVDQVWHIRLVSLLRMVNDEINYHIWGKEGWTIWESS